MSVDRADPLPGDPLWRSFCAVKLTIRLIEGVAKSHGELACCPAKACRQTERNLCLGDPPWRLLYVKQMQIG